MSGKSYILCKMSWKVRERKCAVLCDYCVNIDMCEENHNDNYISNDDSDVVLLLIDAEGMR